jgi:hypothetical protein
VIMMCIIDNYGDYCAYCDDHDGDCSSSRSWLWRCQWWVWLWFLLSVWL